MIGAALPVAFIMGWWKSGSKETIEKTTQNKVVFLSPPITLKDHAPGLGDSNSNARDSPALPPWLGPMGSLDSTAKARWEGDDTTESDKTEAGKVS